MSSCQLWLMSGIADYRFIVTFDALGSIHVVDEAADLCHRIVEIAIVGQSDFLLVDRPNGRCDE